VTNFSKSYNYFLSRLHRFDAACYVTVFLFFQTFLHCHISDSFFQSDETGSIKKRRRDSPRRILYGAGKVTRTLDLLITNQLLYRLSYASITVVPAYSTTAEFFRQCSKTANFDY
jgi:hypothetical protein